MTSSGLVNDCKVIDADVPLDAVIRHPVPCSRILFQITVISQGQFPETTLQYVCVMDHNICQDVITVPDTVTKDRTNDLLMNVILGDLPGLMGEDDRLSPIAFQAFLGEYIFRKSQLPLNAAIIPLVLKNTAGSNDGSIPQVPLFCKISRIQRGTIQAAYSFQFQRFSHSFHFCIPSTGTSSFSNSNTGIATQRHW